MNTYVKFMAGLIVATTLQYESPGFDSLYPEIGYLGEFLLEDNYTPDILRLIKDRFEHGSLAMAVILPTGATEFGVSIGAEYPKRTEAENDLFHDMRQKPLKYSVISVSLKQYYYTKRDRDNANFTVHRKEIDEKTAMLINKLWVEMLVSAKPRRKPSESLDGINAHFYCREENQYGGWVKHSAQADTPGAKSQAGRLVRISYALGGWPMIEDKKESDEELAKIVAQINEMLKEIEAEKKKPEAVEGK